MAVKSMPADSHLALFLANLATAVRDGCDLIAGSIEDMVSPAQAARLIGVSRAHLYKVMDADEIPFVHVGRDRRIRLADVEELLRQRDAASKSMAERFARVDTARAAALEALEI